MPCSGPRSSRSSSATSTSVAAARGAPGRARGRRRRARRRRGRRSPTARACSSVEPCHLESSPSARPSGASTGRRRARSPALRSWIQSVTRERGLEGAVRLRGRRARSAPPRRRGARRALPASPRSRSSPPRRADSRRRPRRSRGTRRGGSPAARRARSRGDSRRRAARARRVAAAPDGPTAWMTWLASRSPPEVIFASPVWQPPSTRHSASSCGPAARWIAPSTPPPPSRFSLAALTIASASGSVVMSPRCSVMRPTGATVRRLPVVAAGSRERPPERRWCRPAYRQPTGCRRMRRLAGDGRSRPAAIRFDPRVLSAALTCAICRSAPSASRSARPWAELRTRRGADRRRGAVRIRTGVNGFAGRCVATPPRRQRGGARVALVARRPRLAPPGPVHTLQPSADRCYPARVPGRLAQLGERRLDKAEVTGSSPVSPTRKALHSRVLSVRCDSTTRMCGGCVMLVGPAPSGTTARWAGGRRTAAAV